MFRECRRQEKLIAGQQVSVEAREKFLKGRKAFKITSTVLVTILISYLPILVARIIQNWFFMSGNSMAAVAHLVSWFSVTVNSFIDRPHHLLYQNEAVPCGVY